MTRVVIWTQFKKFEGLVLTIVEGTWVLAIHKTKISIQELCVYNVLIIIFVKGDVISTTALSVPLIIITGWIQLFLSIL